MSAWPLKKLHQPPPQVFLWLYHLPWLPPCRKSPTVYPCLSPRFRSRRRPCALWPVALLLFSRLRISRWFLQPLLTHHPLLPRHQFHRSRLHPQPLPRPHWQMLRRLHLPRLFPIHRVHHRRRLPCWGYQTLLWFMRPARATRPRPHHRSQSAHQVRHRRHRRLRACRASALCVLAMHR
jgi:hypothetical protein